MEQIKRRFGIGEDAIDADQKTTAHDAEQQPGHGLATALGDRQEADHDGWPDQIELLLDPERPSVQQTLQLGGNVEIAGGKIEADIAERERRVEAPLSEFRVPGK